MSKGILNIFYFGLVSLLYYISYSMYQLDTVEIGLNYKYQMVVINWAYVFLIATTFAVVGLYMSGFNEYIPFLRSRHKDDKPIRLSRTERRAREREAAKTKASRS